MSTLAHRSRRLSWVAAIWEDFGSNRRLRIEPRSRGLPEGLLDRSFRAGIGCEANALPSPVDAALHQASIHHERGIDGGWESGACPKRRARSTGAQAPA
jgi:hypothetical protein